MERSAKWRDKGPREVLYLCSALQARQRNGGAATAAFRRRSDLPQAGERARMLCCGGSPTARRRLQHAAAHPVIPRTLRRCNGGRRQQQRARAQAYNPFAPVQRPILSGRPMRASLFLRVQDTSYQRSAVFSAQPSTALHPTCAAESDGLSARLSTWSCKRRCGTHAEYACVRPQVLFTAGMRRRPG